MSKNSDPEVSFTKETITKCICPDCPSYPHDCKGEILLTVLFIMKINWKDYFFVIKKKLGQAIF